MELFMVVEYTLNFLSTGAGRSGTAARSDGWLRQSVSLGRRPAADHAASADAKGHGADERAGSRRAAPSAEHGAMEPLQSKHAECRRHQATAAAAGAATEPNAAAATAAANGRSDRSPRGRWSNGRRWRRAGSAGAAGAL